MRVHAYEWTGPERCFKNACYNNNNSTVCNKDLGAIEVYLAYCYYKLLILIKVTCGPSAVNIIAKLQNCYANSSIDAPYSVNMKFI